MKPVFILVFYLKYDLDYFVASFAISPIFLPGTMGLSQNTICKIKQLVVSILFFGTKLDDRRKTSPCIVFPFIETKS